MSDRADSVSRNPEVPSSISSNLESPKSTSPARDFGWPVSDRIAKILERVVVSRTHADERACVADKVVPDPQEDSCRNRLRRSKIGS